MAAASNGELASSQPTEVRGQKHQQQPQKLYHHQSSSTDILVDKFPRMLQMQGKYFIFVAISRVFSHRIYFQRGHPASGGRAEARSRPRGGRGHLIFRPPFGTWRRNLSTKMYWSSNDLRLRNCKGADDFDLISFCTIRILKYTSISTSNM